MIKHLKFLLLTLCLVSTNGNVIAGEPPAPGSGHAYAVRGVVMEIAPDRRSAVIRHEAVENYMPAMTMTFNARNTNELAAVTIGDSITFRLTTTDDTHWIDQIARVPGSRAGISPPPAMAKPSRPAELRPGDGLPDCELLGDDGERVQFSDFRGQALAFTFFFTRCPLPDYCPRMSNNFAKARELMLAANNAPTNWHFLSISFDPDFDKPGVLSAYAKAYRGNNTNRWSLASASRQVLADLAPRLDLMVHRDPKGGISHNLRTVVLDPRGRIFRQFDGNDWTPRQLADALLEAARRPAQP